MISGYLAIVILDNLNVVVFFREEVRVSSDVHYSSATDSVK